MSDRIDDVDTTMPAVVRTADGPRLAARAVPRPPAGWVRLRVEIAGVCRTDVAAARGQLVVDDGRVLGHELAGTVDVVGDGVDGALVGGRASVDPRLDEGRFLGLHDDGAFAGFVCVPVRALVPVPMTLSARHAAFVEPVAAALSVRAARLPAGARAGLTGGGRIAALTARVLALDGIEVVPVDATSPTLGGHASSLDALVHTAATGLPVLSGLRRGTRVVVKSRPAAPVVVDVRAVTERELVLVGAAWGDFVEAVALLASGALVIDDLLGPVWPLSSYARAFDASEDAKIFLAPER